MDLPTAADVAAYLQLVDPTPEVLAEVTVSLEVAVEAQQARCDVGDYTRSLWQACRRRAARDLAARGAVLGVVDMGEMGAVRVSSWDATIEVLEGPYRRAAIA